MNTTRALERGWSTIEFLLVFPVLVATFTIAIHFGMVMKSKIALKNAAHAAVQALARTQDCGKAKEYLEANFDKPGVSLICDPGSERSTVIATYTYAEAMFLFIPIPEVPLKEEAFALTEK